MWWRGSASFLETHRKSCAASISLKIDSKFKTDSNIFQATIGLNSIDVLVIVLCMKKIWVRNLFWTVYTRVLQNAFWFVMRFRSKCEKTCWRALEYTVQEGILAQIFFMHGGLAGTCMLSRRLKVAAAGRGAVFESTIGLGTPNNIIKLSCTYLFYFFLLLD